jgi:hypothetical protein
VLRFLHFSERCSAKMEKYDRLPAKKASFAKAAFAAAFANEV